MGERLDREDREVSEESGVVEGQLDPISMPLPVVDTIRDMSPIEQEHHIAQHFDRQVEHYFADDRVEEGEVVDDIAEGGEGDGRTPTIPLGESVGDLQLDSPEKLQQAIDKVQSYWDKRHEVEEITRSLKKVPLAKVTPSVVAAIKDKDIRPMALSEIESLVDAELNKAMHDNTALALYDALGEHWNDEISLSDTLKSRGGRDTTMQFHLNAGASSALSALGKEFVGVRYDTSRLITDGNIELAAASLALAVARKYPTTSDQYSHVVNRLREHNSVNQKVTETRALERHGRLTKQYEVIQQQKRDAELLDKVQIATLEADNLIAQRANLGAALGSLQSSATFFDYLERLKGAKRAPVVSIGVGDQADLAESIRDKLGLKKDYDIDVSDPSNVTLNVGLSSLSKYMKEAPDVSVQEELYSQLKTSMEGVTEDAGGNLIVDQYSVPGWKDIFTDAAGEDRSYKWRVEQRNDIEWLREATSESEVNPNGVGGGLITRVTGAGKTNTALGFYAHKISENPDYKGLVVVPRGRSAQWYEEAQRFSDTPTVLISDGTAKAQVDELIADSKPGTIYVMGHREAARSHEVIGLMQSDPEFADKRFGGLTIDEPQELQARGSEWECRGAG